MAILRAGLIAACLILATCVAIVAVRLCRPGGRVAQGLARLFCRAMLRLLRIRVTVTGVPPRTGDGRLLVANHVSWIDPLVLLAVTPAAVLAKREVGTWPAIGALARLQATVFVDRQRRRCIPAVNRDLSARLAERRNVLLFPEGTTHDGERRGRFLTSHLACLAGMPEGAAACVQVAALTYSHRHAAWIGDDTLLPHLWSVLRRPGMTCRVAFGPPVTVSRHLDRKALGRRLAAEVEDLLPSPSSKAESGKSRIPGSAPGLIVTQA